MQSLLQTQAWVDFKASQGWKIHIVDEIFVLEKKLPFGKSFLYAPEVTWRAISGHPEASAEGSLGLSKLSYSRQILRDAQNDIQIFLTNIKKIAQNSHAIFFRLEILDDFDQKIVDIFKKNGFIKSFEEVQPEWRQIIDISRTEEEILTQMKQKGRYNIRVAQKHGIIIEKSENLADFYKIFRETAKRDGFETRPKKYFEKLLQILKENDVAELWLAKYNGKTIAAIIVTFYNEVASYLYGASSNESRNLMAPYLLHWKVIQEAKEKGCKSYDLLAIAPGGVEKHKYAGITRFKEQFGGRKVQIVGSWDLIYKPTWYWLFKIAESLRRK